MDTSQTEEIKKYPCPVCQTGMDSQPSNQVFGLRDNLLLLLIKENVEIKHCPNCSATLIYDSKEYSKILTPDKKIII